MPLVSRDVHTVTNGLPGAPCEDGDSHLRARPVDPDYRLISS